jgi:polar amino acid transport system substrate-binding protein
MWHSACVSAPSGVVTFLFTDIEGSTMTSFDKWGTVTVRFWSPAWRVAYKIARSVAGTRPTTVKPMQSLRVGAAFPDPPFNGMPDDGGLDIDLMEAIAEKLGTTAEFIPYEGRDFNKIFDALNAKAFDCVAAGTTVTPEREKKAKFAPPYVISGQSLAVDTSRLPNVHSIDDLAGLTIGVQQGNTSLPIAEKLAAEGKAARVRVYDYGQIRPALNDLTTGGCDAFMKLAPVLTELVKPIAGVEVVQRGISTENIAIAVGLEDQSLLARITVAQAELEDDGTLQRIRRKWLGNPFTDQSLAAH